LQADDRSEAWLVLLTPLQLAQRTSLLETAVAGGRPVLLIDPQLEAEDPWWLNWTGWRDVIFPETGGHFLLRVKLHLFGLLLGRGELVILENELLAVHPPNPGLRFQSLCRVDGLGFPGSH
jgi:hypothetical protein